MSHPHSSVIGVWPSIYLSYTKAHLPSVGPNPISLYLPRLSNFLEVISVGVSKILGEPTHTLVSSVGRLKTLASKEPVYGLF